MKRPFKLAYLVSHPIQYQAPLLRYIASREEIDLTVFFLSDFSARGYLDPGFGSIIRWDVPLLDGYKYIVLPSLGRKDKISFWEPFTIRLWHHLKQGNFQALWIHGYNHFTCFQAVCLAKLLGIKILLRGESHLTSLRRSTPKVFVKEWIFPKFFSVIDGFLAIGSLNRRYYTHYGVSTDRIFLMPYAVDNFYFQKKANEGRYRAKGLKKDLQLHPERPIILFASKFQKEKRPSDLLEAYINLSPDGKQEPLPYLLFIGEGKERSRLEMRVKVLGWESIKFLGFKNQSELPSYYALCDVFVLCSEFETWGIVVNEVMNAGKPVIVSDQVGAGPDLIIDGENGFVVPVGHISLLSTRLLQLTSDAELVTKMGRASLKRIASWNFASDYDGLLGALKQNVG